MPLSKRTNDFAVAAAIVAIVGAISLIGIQLPAGSLDLAPRFNLPILTIDVFLLLLAAAVAASGRPRRVFFHLLAWTFPLALLATAEVGARAIRLADRIAPLEDMSVLVNKDIWPLQLMTRDRKGLNEGLVLYRPWQGDGISINELGLRTALPSPKGAKEWRIAVTGGSAAWGWRMLDADTIPVQLQQILRRRGHSNVTVYNFAIDDIAIADELAVLKRFRGPYAIDQVIFYTGGNDSRNSYLGGANDSANNRPSNVLAKDHSGANLFDLVQLAGRLSGANAFELIKAAARLKAVTIGPSPSLLAKLDSVVLPNLAQRNSLRDGLIAAGEYCRELAIRCDFVLQPMLMTRQSPIGPEIQLTRTLERIYPRYREVVATMYRTAVSTGLTIHDQSKMFDQSIDPYFFDLVHVNEAGNRLAAERIAAIISAGLH